MSLHTAAGTWLKTDVLSAQMVTTGFKLGLNAPASYPGFPLGFATIGGRKKKSVFPECVPSEIANDGDTSGLEFGSVESPPLQPANTTNAKTDSNG